MAAINDHYIYVHVHVQALLYYIIMVRKGQRKVLLRVDLWAMFLAFKRQTHVTCKGSPSLHEAISNAYKYMWQKLHSSYTSSCYVKCPQLKVKNLY